MKIFVFRNSTIEHLFKRFDVSFSGYNDILSFKQDAEMFIWFYTTPIKADQQKVCEEINSFQATLDFVLHQLQPSQTILAFTLTELSVVVYEKINNPVKNAIMTFNNFLTEKAKKHSNLKVVDFTSFTRDFSPEVLTDWKFYYLSMMSISPKLSNEFNAWFVAQLDSIALRRKKCIVLDLDNTIWGGILGEDEIQGIKVGGGYPGNAFADFQEGLAELSKKGILLTICSKNNESDVLSVWDKLPGMVLKKQDFTASRINWKDKAQNIEEISKELNLGLDSFVFLDDSPTERELIKGMLPMVEVPEFPTQPYALREFFKSLVDKYFAIYKLTDEDLLKNQQYRENAQRAEFQRLYSSFDEYIRNLEIEVSIMQANEFNISRITQMTQKTNQFNLTTKRYTDSNILNLLNHGSWIHCINVKDRFGDNGITGLLIIQVNLDNKLASIDSFLLSCRILGKKIEDQFLAYILDKLFLQGINEVRSKFIPTSKNEQVSDFFDKHGFTLINTNNSGEKNYSLKREDFSYQISNNYKIIEP
jgi:FkbH-like protein